MGPLRQSRLYHVTRRVLGRYLGLDDFRVVHLSIQQNHFHLLVEAADRAALTRRMQSLSITLAKAINRELGRCGTRRVRCVERCANELDDLRCRVAR